MAKRLYAIARDLKTDCRTLMKIAQRAGYIFKSHMSVCNDAEEMNLRQGYRLQLAASATPKPQPQPKVVSVVGKTPPPLSTPSRSGHYATPGTPTGPAIRPGTLTTASPGRPGAESQEVEILSSEVTSRPSKIGPRPGGPGGPGGPGKPGARPVPTPISTSTPTNRGISTVPAPRTAVDEEEDARNKKKGAGGVGDRRRRDSGVPMSDDDEGRHRKIRKVTYDSPKQAIAPKDNKVVVILPVTVKQLTVDFGMKSDKIIGELMKKGKMKRITDVLTEEEVLELAIAFNLEATIQQGQTEESQADKMLAEMAVADSENPADMKPRPPVVVVMGHVDHGKTSLLDRIRETDVAGGEAGGITQHIGASVVRTEDGREITFLDTPGHEAFTAMRARGTSVTDIAVLVVAADDGVMPTTLEAIDHAKAAKVPFIVAMNKIDKPGANSERIKGQLAKHGLVPTGDWGGDTEVVETSARPEKPLGIKDLLDTILLQAEVMELKANPKSPARGVVIEAKKDDREGPSATVLVQSGTLHIGDYLLAGEARGRVRAIYDDHGKQLTEVPPGHPGRVLGLDSVPLAGDKFFVVADQTKARELAEIEKNKRKKTQTILPTGGAGSPTADDFLKSIAAGEVNEVPLVVKADTQGSVEALKVELSKLSNDKVKVSLLRVAVGAITETDVLLAESVRSVKSYVIGFHVIADEKAQSRASQSNVEIRTFRIIYEVVDYVRALLTGQLAPEQVEVKLGKADVRQTFQVSKVGTVAGLLVTSGSIVRSSRVRVYRNGVEISPEKGYEIASLKRFKDDVREVKAGFECGLQIGNFNDVKPGDVLEFFKVEERAPAEVGAGASSSGRG